MSPRVDYELAGEVQHEDEIESRPMPLAELTYLGLDARRARMLAEAETLEALRLAHAVGVPCPDRRTP